MLFLMPPVELLATALVPWAVGALFTARIALNPFYSSFNPASHTESGPQRLLPVELTLLNNLPITTRSERVRVWFGTSPRFQVYFLDDNAYPREGEAFWVRGDSRTRSRAQGRRLRDDASADRRRAAAWRCMLRRRSAGRRSRRTSLPGSRRCWNCRYRPAFHTRAPGRGRSRCRCRAASSRCSMPAAATTASSESACR